MATGTDALLEHLLFKIALSGEQGFGIRALSDAFIDYNSKLHIDEATEEKQDDGDILFSLRPPGAKSDANSKASDPHHLEKLWTWLVQHPDVSVQQRNINKEQKSSKSTDASTRSGPLIPVFEAHANERLYTTENRIWHALTDHDVDWKRIPKLEFRCLMAIGAAGPQGVLQPDVTSITGQDKRSVPKRTDALAQKGYITKSGCAGGGIKTSVLLLKKFSQEVQNSTYIEIKSQSGKGKEGDIRRMVHYENWYHETMEILKKHNNLIAYEDLRKEMGIFGLRWETRALHRCIKRLEKAGCVQRLRARLEVEEPPKSRRRQSTVASDGSQDREAAVGENPSPSKQKIRWVRCIKLMREPTDKDKEAFISTAKIKTEKAAEGQDDSDADADADNDEEYIEVDAAVLPALDKMAETTQRLPPQWQPGMHPTQFHYSLIHSSGTKGLSTMGLADIGVGHFWRRPLDELLSRLTDVWTTSQPLHLRHLAIIRDTSFHNRVSHYVFRSFENFQKLVDTGEAAWEAIGIKPSEIAKQPDLDAWGFPKVKPSTMVGPEGIANMAYAKNTVARYRNRRHIFERTEAEIHAPKGYNKRQSAASSTPSRRASAIAATISTPASDTPDIDDDDIPAPQTAKQYKKNLWQMNPKRVEAELTAWKARAHKLAESRARKEFGLSLKPDVPKPTKRRHKRKIEEVAGESTTQTVVTQPKVAADAAGDAVSASQLGSPTNDGAASSASFSLQRGGQPVTQLDLQSVVPSIEQASGLVQPFTDQPAQPSGTPVESVAGKSGEQSTGQVKGESGMPSDLEKRVSEIEDEILNKAKPGVYINPPGSGQMKNNVFQPKGRPSRYLIAVFKTEKLKSLAWFNEEEDIYVTRPAGLSPSPAPDARPGEASPSDDVASKSSEKPDDQLIIKNGRRAMITRKRKATTSLRERVTKKLATEYSYELQSPSAATPTKKPIQQTERPIESPQQGLSPATAPSAPDPTAEAERLIIVSQTPPRSIIPMPQQSTVTERPSVATQASTQGVAEDDVPTQVGPSLQPTWNAFSSTVPTGQQAFAGAGMADVQMQDAPGMEGQMQSEQQEKEQTPIPVSAVDSTSVQPVQAHTTTPQSIERPVQASTPAREIRYPSILPSPAASVRTPNRRHGNSKAQTKVGVGRSGGIVSFNRERMVLELVHKNGGIFGGDRELFYPFVTAWERQYQRRPDRHTLDRVLAALVEDGRLKRTSFTFTATNGTVATKSVVMEPHINPECSEIAELKKNIAEYFPISYLPEGVDLAPDLRKHVESDVRNVEAKRPTSMNTIRTYFPEDSSLSVSRINYPTKVELGMTEATVQKGISVRRRRREEEERRQQRYLQAQMDEEIEEAVAALTTDFQLDSYEHDPSRAYVDRGPRGRGRLAKLQRWGAEDHIVPRRALGLLTANTDEQEAERNKEAERNSMNAAAASDFGVMVMPKAQQVPVVDQINPPSHTAPDPPTEVPESLSQILQNAANAAGTFNVIEALSMTSPFQRFHPLSGTFSTDPVIITTTSNKPSQTVLSGAQMPMTLADIFKQAGEEATMLQQSAQPLLPGHYEVPSFASTMPAPRRVTMPSARPRPPPSTLPEYRAYQQRAIIPRTARTGIFSMSDREEQRLIYAVAAVKTLCGGLEQMVNWGLVHQVFHYKFDPNYCRHRYGLLRNKHGGTADKIQVEFQRYFPEAYERGEVPPIDFVEPEKYDWIRIVDWAESRLSKPKVSSSMPALPKSREAFDGRFDLQNATDVYSVAREDFWVPNITQLRREELANNWTFIRPLEKGSRQASTEDELMMAKSWVRANVVTPDAVYDSNAAHNRLIKVENDLPRALEQLLGAKIIRMENKGRQIPGRNYDISDQVLHMFKRQWDIRFLRSTAAYKTTIDKAFATDGKITISYQAQDPETTAMTNLVSAGRAKIVPILPRTDHTLFAPYPRLSKWGFTEGNYKTVHMDKSRLHFGLELHPTDTYVAGYPITKVPPPLVRYFPGEIGPRLPLWTDINGDLIESYWEMVLMATLWLLAFRPGLTVKDMSKGAYKGKLWEWELEMFLQWAEKSGIARKLDTKGKEGEAGWITAEWWWLAFMEQTGMEE